jgi:hypothetical protein
MNDQILYATYQHNVIIKSEYTLEKIERAFKNEKLATLGTQDTILVLIYISVNKCMLSTYNLIYQFITFLKCQHCATCDICKEIRSPQEQF